MYYLDKIFEILIVLLINVLLVFLGHLFLRLIFKKKEYSFSNILISFGLGAGMFAFCLFFYGAVLGLSKISFCCFLCFFLILSLFEILTSWTDVKKSLLNLITQKDFSIHEKLLFILLIFLIAYNLYRGCWPDVDFDSTWYHLTEPKVYLMNEKIQYIKGGLLYYSAMPQLIEMFYLLGLFVKSGITAKLFHTFVGIWCVSLAYVWGKDIGKSRISGLISALLFYGSNIVFWESQNAYIDLGVTLFISLTVWQFSKSLKKDSRYFNLILTSIFLGFSLGSKLLSIYWVFILLLANLFFLIISKNFSLRIFIIESLILGGIPFLMWFPWGIYSYIYTNNPVYPLMEGLFNNNDWFSSTQMEGLTGFAWFKMRVIQLFDLPRQIIHGAYDYSPLLFYGFFFSVLIFLKEQKTKVMVLIFLLFILLWNFTPASGDRFLLPVIIIVSVYSGKFLNEMFNRKDLITKDLIILVIIINVFLQYAYHYFQFTPSHWIFSESTEKDYLKNNVSQNIWAFYDYDGNVSEIVGDSKVLVYNIHNLFYLNFDFDDVSFIKNDVISNNDGGELLKQNYEYLLIKRSSPENFYNEIGITELYLKLIYEDDFSEIKLYEII